MKVGGKMSRSDIGAEWRFVEADLYDIVRRVKEYDSDAALVRSDRDGQLGIARKAPNLAFISGTEWVLARPLEMYGEPDARVIQTMRESDAWTRPGGLKKYHREVEQAGKEITRKQRQEIVNSEREAEAAAWALRRDMGHRDTISI